MNLRAVLFDLDNTLILFNEKSFFKQYSKAIYQHFADIMSVDQFSLKLNQSVIKMTHNDGKRPNVEIFMDAFADGIDETKENLWLSFKTFYDNDFESLSDLMHPIEGAHETVSYCKKNELKIVVATNPMFPANVQLMRLKWAGLEEIEFDLITDVYNSSFCKPFLEYYTEICLKINVDPQNCLMVGNDEYYDMIAAKIGMKTFLTSDCKKMSLEYSRVLSNNQEIEIPTSDYQGQLSEVPKVIDKLNSPKIVKRKEV